eukprot:513957_1
MTTGNDEEVELNYATQRVKSHDEEDDETDTVADENLNLVTNQPKEDNISCCCCAALNGMIVWMVWLFIFNLLTNIIFIVLSIITKYEKGGIIAFAVFQTIVRLFMNISGCIVIHSIRKKQITSQLYDPVSFGLMAICFTCILDIIFLIYINYLHLIFESYNNIQLSCHRHHKQHRLML